MTLGEIIFGKLPPIRDIPSTEEARKIIKDFDFNISKHFYGSCNIDEDGKYIDFETRKAKLKGYDWLDVKKTA